MQKILLSFLGGIILSSSAVHAKNHTDYRAIKQKVMENDRNYLMALRDKKLAQIKTTSETVPLTSLTTREEARQHTQLQRRERLLHSYTFSKIN